VATALGVIESALREIGVLAEGETASAAGAAEALLRLNRFIDRLGVERLTIYTRTRTTWTITANDGNYSIGSAGDVAIARPVYVDDVGYIDSSTSPTSEYLLRRLTEAEYAAITLKSETSTYPTHYYLNPTYANATLDLWPVPTSTTLSGVIYAWTALTQFSALTTTVALPPGYEEMLVTNLAILLCPTYGVQPHPVLVDTARRTMADIKRANIRDYELEMEATASFPHPWWRTRYNIYLG